MGADFERADFGQRKGCGVRMSKCVCGNGCDSHLECMFWHHMRKTQLDEQGTEHQKAIGRYRVDAFVDCDGQKVVVELDGKAFHNQERDAIRDEFVLQHCDAVIRIPFAAMWYYERATFEVLAYWFPRFRIAKDVCVHSLAELQQRIENMQEDFYNYELGMSKREYLDKIEFIVDVWDADDKFGFVGSPKAFVYNWNITPIVLKRKAAR